MTTKLDLYLGFDKDFFNTERWDVTEEERANEINHTSSNYRGLLEMNSQLLNSVLDNDADPEALSTEFYKHLNGLCSLEKRHGCIASKGITIPELLAPFGYDKQRTQSYFYNGRVCIHLTRLILPEFYSADMIRISRIDPNKIHNTFCRDFGASYIRYCNTKTEDIRESDIIHRKIGSEGEGVFTFWTIVPYVFADLKQRGNDESQAMEKVFRWIFESYGEESRFQPKFAPVGMHFGFLKFPEPLGFDERMPTHLRARLLSKVTACRINQ